MMNLQIDQNIEYIVDILMVIFQYLDLCVIDDVLEKINIRNVYYERKKIIKLNML